jgi:hypothetical protein
LAKLLPNDRQSAAARKTVAGWLDSTQNIAPTKVYSNCTTDRKSKHTQGNTHSNKTLLWQSAALALLGSFCLAKT